MIVVSVSLLLGEVSVRLLAPEWLRTLMRERLAGNAVTLGSDEASQFEQKDGHFIRFKPFAEFTQLTREWGNRVHIDGRGGRMVRAVSDTGPPLFWLGDSFTFGSGVKDEETFVSRTCWSEGKPCVNLGVPGSCLSDHLDIIERRAQELGSPSKYVFVVFLGNDLEDMISRTEQSFNFSKQTANSHVPNVVNRLNSAAQPLFQHSYAAQLVKSICLQLLNRRAQNVLGDPIFSLMQGSPEYRQRAEAVLSQNLDRLQRLAGDLRFSARFVLIPDKFQISRTARENKSVYYGLDPARLQPRLPNEIVRRQLTKRKLEFVDLTDDLEERSDLYYVWDNHLTSKGHAYVAECLVRIWHDRL